ncbi:hypothetical protein HFN89_00105 [Rhizobium laguerreae]|nr:hypothetical protein [Rhizobium laguerreae]
MEEIKELVENDVDDFEIEIDVTKPGRIYQDDLTLHGVEYAGDDYGSATSYWKYGFRYVLKDKQGVRQPFVASFDYWGIDNEESDAAAWKSKLVGGYATYYPHNTGLEPETVPTSFVMTYAYEDANRLVELAPDRFEFATWDEVQHWDLVSLGLDTFPNDAVGKIEQWHSLRTTVGEGS